MSNQLKLYHGEIGFGYEDSSGTIGSFRVGSQYFVGKSPEDILKEQSELLENLRQEYLGKPSLACSQNSDKEYTFTKLSPGITLTEVTIPGFKITLDKLVDSE